ncbi:phenylacetate--CoA ligase family protein [Paenibacillus sp. J2TS4]|uniref:phenylacetate--CoA ligase family protein n=1 Tax=Paenibacillus sp. J2TS4 TaxID=2807194 RepID=UPI001B02326C|nr:hypothetical protein [Paenibacillus sp. J2TS4]GIP35025.1 capsular polysaccharide biosynthesis protein CapK [Paenibacillus sp. J2TS4]
MGLKEKVYNASPSWCQDLLISMYGMKLASERFGKTYQRFKQFYAESDHWDLRQLKQYQQQAFTRLLRHAYANSEFYRNYYQGLDIEAITEGESLKSLPVLEKQQLRENVDKIRVPIHKPIFSVTGGTTGTPLKVAYTIDNFQERQAYLANFKEKFGVVHGMRRATFSGRTIVPLQAAKGSNFWRYNRPIKQMLYSTFHMDEPNMMDYVNSINKFKPQQIDGFPFAIHVLADFIDRHSIPLQFKPLAIFTTAETLYDYQKVLISKVFDCPVINQYASSEGAPFIIECSRGNLHYDLRTGIIEEDAEGALVTSFTTYGTPLIRYRVGDSIILEEESTTCGCGNHNPLVKVIEGRTQDYLLSSDRGKVRIGSTILKDVPPVVIKSQFVQTRIDEVEFKLVTQGNHRLEEKYEETIRHEIQKRMGPATKIRLNYVDKIDVEKNGKFRYIKNSLI